MIPIWVNVGDGRGSEGRVVSGTQAAERDICGDDEVPL